MMNALDARGNRSRTISPGTMLSIAAIVVVGALGTWFKATGCRPTTAGLGASVTWDGRGYAVAWPDQSDPRKAIIYGARVTPRSGKFSDPVAIGEVADLIAAPELIAGAHDAGYLLVMNTGARGLLASPLTRDFERPSDTTWHVLAPSQVTLCTSPVWTGDVYGVAWGAQVGDDEIAYYLARAGQDGQLAVEHLLSTPGDTPACAISARGARISLAYASTPRGQRHTHLSLAHIDGHGIIASADIDVEDIGDTSSTDNAGDAITIEPLRLMSHGADYRLLYRVRGEVHVMRLSARGERLSDHQLPAPVSPHTVDMAANEHQFVAGWSSERYAELGWFDNRGTEHHHWRSRKRPHLSGLRMTTHGRACAGVWTELNGSFVWLYAFSRCLSNGSDLSSSQDAAIHQVRASR